MNFLRPSCDSPSSACRHLLPASGEKATCRNVDFSLDGSRGTSPLPVHGERARVRGIPCGPLIRPC
ncbi:unnamed protein product [Ciceribacter selenitireducens ATCC BAA-1503]|uniref:Uncharacterized protein n=1 Tax=Ciceribacter selenitireducens ATCC BAA-1503 TaxID=1336235 RepID=A0A376ACG7_9HYPH|nr:unnamed protein product [Ciceribacter selenitireducens ATCC BAA-1503]